MNRCALFDMLFTIALVFVGIANASPFLMSLEASSSSNASSTPNKSTSSSRTNSNSISPTSSAASSSTSFSISTGPITSAIPSSSRAVLTEPSQNQTENGLIAPAYFNPFAFTNPYYFMFINTQGEDDKSTIASCAQTWGSSFDKWLKTASYTSGPVIDLTTETTTLYEAVTTEVVPFGPKVSQIIPQVVTSTIIGKGPNYYVDQYLDFTASEPCCFGCTIFGGSVQVYYWPSTTPSSLPTSLPVSNHPTTFQPTVSTLVNDVGFTFVSPSIYVAFQSIHAVNLCGNVGPQYPATTLAFMPGELSTSAAYFVLSTLDWKVVLDGKSPVSWTAATFGDQASCDDVEVTSYHIGNMAWTDLAQASSAVSSILAENPIPGVDPSNLIGSNVFTHNPCKPTLSIPSRILSLNSEWRSCAAPITAWLDPPYVLSQGNGLTAFAPPTSLAAPGPTAAPDIASVTVASSLTPANEAFQSVLPSASSSIEIQPVKVVTISQSSIASPSNEIDPQQASPTNAALSLPIESEGNPASNQAPNNPETTVSIHSTVDQHPSALSSPAVLGFGTSFFTADKSSHFVIASNTLGPGSEVTISGTHVSLASNGVYAIFDGTSTQLLAPSASPKTVLNFGSSAITADESSNFIVASQTLDPGHEVTVSGTTISLASNGAYVVLDGTSTQFLSTVRPTPIQDAPVSGSPNAEAKPTATYTISSQPSSQNRPPIAEEGSALSMSPSVSSVPADSSTVASSDLGSVTSSAGTMPSHTSLGAIILSAGGFALNSETDSAVATGTGAASGSHSGKSSTGGSSKTNNQWSVWIMGLLGVGVLSVHLF